MATEIAMIEKVEIGDAVLYHGDCLEILPTLGKVDAVVTDPPYGVGLTVKKNDYRHSKYFDNGASLQATTLYEDSPEHVEVLIKKVMPILLSLTKRAAITTGQAMLFHYPVPTAIGAVYIPNGAGMCSWGFLVFQPILYYGKCPYMATGKGPRPNGFKTEQPNRELIDHPCPKPIAWMNWLVNRASLYDEVVLDPFMGSGTTGVACANLGRKFIGIEIEKRYFDIACERIEMAYSQGRLFV